MHICLFRKTVYAFGRQLYSHSAFSCSSVLTSQSYIMSTDFIFCWEKFYAYYLPTKFFFKGIPLFLLFIYLFIYSLAVLGVFVSVQGPSLVAASGGHSSSPRVGLSLSRPLSLRSTGSRHAGSVVVAHGPSCSAACGIFPDQGSNQCPLHWQADSQPLRHQGSPYKIYLLCLYARDT